MARASPGTTDQTKYSLVVAALDENMTTRVLDILPHTPPTNNYAILKDNLVDTFRSSEREAAAKIMEQGLGVSKLLDSMLALVSPILVRHFTFYLKKYSSAVNLGPGPHNSTEIRPAALRKGN